MLMGKRQLVVAANTGMDKIVKKENMGYIIDFNQTNFSELLTHIFKKIAKNFMKKVLNCPARAYKKYSWEEMKKSICSLYEELN